MASFEQLLRKREGVRMIVYLDQLKKPTVGVGHLVLPADKLKVGDEITDKQVSEFFKKDSAKAMSAARSQAAKAGIKDPDFLVYLGSVNYQLGTGWTRTFKKTWAMIVDGKYEDAVAALDKSLWKKQTPKRVKDFQGALLRLKPKQAAGPAASAPVAA